MKKKTTFEYTQAPSGKATTSGYPPFIPFTEGYGFLGVILVDSVSGQVQCHFCGQWFDGLITHVWRVHSLKAQEYRKKTSLLKKAQLNSKKIHRKMRLHALKHSAKSNLIPGKWKRTPEYRERARLNGIARGSNIQEQNRRNTSIPQLIERLKSEYTRLGKRFDTKAIGALYVTINRKMKFSEACKMAGIPLRKPGNQPGIRKSYRENFIRIVDMTRKLNRIPTNKEMGTSLTDWFTRKRGNNPRRKTSLTKILKKISKGDTELEKFLKI